MSSFMCFAFLDTFGLTNYSFPLGIETEVRKSFMSCVLFITFYSLSLSPSLTPPSSLRYVWTWAQVSVHYAQKRASILVTWGGTLWS